MSRYITTSRVKRDDLICGYANIPFGQEILCDENGILCYIKNGETKYLCKSTSERGYLWFAYNEDGLGLERRKIIDNCRAIMASMSKEEKDKKFIFFFYDTIALKYKKHLNDFTEWSWDRAKIHTAPIKDLEHIYHLLQQMKE